MLNNISFFFKISFPTITLIFLTFFNLFIAKDFFDFGQLFIFQAIFFWLLYLPRFLPFYIILFLGIFQDIIYLSPLGSTSLIFFFLIFLFDKYNKFFLEPSFVELYLSFIFLFCIGSISLWSMNSLINLKVLSININLLYEIFLNIFFFPINYFILYIFFKKLNLEKKL